MDIRVKFQAKHAEMCTHCIFISLCLPSYSDLRYDFDKKKERRMILSNLNIQHLHEKYKMQIPILTPISRVIVLGFSLNNYLSMMKFNFNKFLKYSVIRTFYLLKIIILFLKLVLAL